MPKIYSAQKTLAFCRFSAPGIYFLEKLFHPVASMLVRSTTFLNKHFAKKNHNISVDELSHALELTDKAEISEENNILEGIIRFGGETVKEVMTSRLDMVDLDVRTPFKEVMQCIIENAYSRIPIYSGSRDNIKGVLYIKDLLPHVNKGDNFRWQSLIRPAYFVPETKMIDDLLRDFQANKIHIAIVVDEFGGTSGLVTMEDIIEEIVGEIHDEYDDEERTYVVLNDHTWIFEAKTQLTDFYKIAKVDEDEFYMPKDIQKYFKSYLKDKDSLKIIKSNTKEYNLIMGLLNTYGVLSYDKFYEMFNNIISCDKEYLFDRLTILNNFYGEFELYFSKKEKYVCNKAILKEKGIQLKDIKKYVNKKSDYKTFSSKELTSMFSYKYMSKFKSFKKMLSFVKKNYYLDEKDIRVFYKYVIIPYLNDVQIDNPTKEDNLSKNIDKYFEYKNEKHKNKFMDLVKGIINEAPMWKYNGYSEIEKEKGIV